MNTCCYCRKKFDPRYEEDTCDRCGGGIIESDNDHLIDWMGEYDSDGF
jgi:rRNA maturation endonuclease Nob1